MTKHNHHFVWAGDRFMCSYCGKKSKLKRTLPIAKIVCIAAFFIAGLLILSNSYLSSNIISTTENLKQKIVSLSGQVSALNSNLQTGQTVNTTTNQQTVEVTIKAPTIQPMKASVPTIDSSGQSDQNNQQDTQNQPTSQSTYTKQELYQYALQLINQDRASKGLGPVQLDENNQAAQTQADDMLRVNQLSHWMSTGEKPYVSFTRFGGYGYVAQNAAGGPKYNDIAGCIDGTYSCDPVDAKEEIKNSEWQMMYNDSNVKIPWGHRDNILDKHHTKVSIGVAYDQYSFYMVQNFENNYIDYTIPISENNGIVSFAGNLESGALYAIGVFYDPLPTNALYEQHKNDGFYDQGNQLVIVESPPQGNYYIPPSNNTFEVANNWGQQGNIVDVSFDISPFVTKAGVYTVYVMLQDNNGDQFPVTSYSIIKNSPMVQDGFKSSEVYYACTSDQLGQYNQLQQKENLLNQQIDSLQKQIDSMKPQVQSIPPTVPEAEYSYDQRIIDNYNNLVNQDDALVNQFNTLQNQLENFRC